MSPIIMVEIDGLYMESATCQWNFHNLHSIPNYHERSWVFL